MNNDKNFKSLFIVVVIALVIVNIPLFINILMLDIDFITMLLDIVEFLVTTILFAYLSIPIFIKLFRYLNSKVAGNTKYGIVKYFVMLKEILVVIPLIGILVNRGLYMFNVTNVYDVANLFFSNMLLISVSFIIRLIFEKYSNN